MTSLARGFDSLVAELVSLAEDAGHALTKRESLGIVASVGEDTTVAYLTSVGVQSTYIIKEGWVLTYVKHGSDEEWNRARIHLVIEHLKRIA